MEHEHKKSTPVPKVMRFVGMTMSVLYILLGIAVLLYKERLLSIPPSYIWPLGSMLIVYGVFRGYRFYQRYSE